MGNNNLSIWEKVEKTDPKYTKEANVKGNKITSIAPQYQIKNVTEQFGVYGETWGFESLDFDYTLLELGMVVLHAVFFFPGGKFPIKNAQSLFIDNAKTKIDDNFAKKLETDTLTKAISKLGFNADIFMGKFDDVKYLNEVREEFKEEESPIIKNLKQSIEDSNTINELMDVYKNAIDLFKEDKNLMSVLTAKKAKIKLNG